MANQVAAARFKSRADKLMGKTRGAMMTLMQPKVGECRESGRKTKLPSRSRSTQRAESTKSSH